MKKRPLLVDAILGLLLTLGVLGSYVLQLPFIESLELKGYDLRSRLRQSVDAGADIAIIAIDDDSIARLGRWPWSRTRIAEMIDLLAKAQPKVIGLNILFSEPEANQGLVEIKALQAKYDELTAAKQVVEKKGVAFTAEFSSAAIRLDTESRFLQAIADAKNVVLPMAFDTGELLSAKPEPLPPVISSSAMTAQVSRQEVALVEAAKAIVPLPQLAERALGLGHVSVFNDLDGVVRRETPAVVYNGEHFPSYALELVLAYLGFKPSDAKVIPGDRIEVGKLKVPLDDSQSMLVSFYGNYQTFRYFPFHDVLNGKVQPDIFKGKIVLIGPSATGIATLYTTPVAKNLPSVELVANAVENILRQKFLVRPAWATNAEFGLIVLMGLFIMAGLPRLKAGMGALVSVVLLVGVLGAGTTLFIKGEWVKVVYPAFLLAVGYILLTTKRFIFTERGKELVEASAIETNKMLGLSFQGQGMLDLAFDKFRLCPLDDQLKDLLYNLALDFERKRQYNKAVAVYEHIAKADAAYKDIQDKMKVLRQAAEGAVFGGIGGGQKEGTVMIAAGKGEKPKLGRYEIEKELGRGAMGVVYL
ncbi:MAG: CHASE2 domain-containing protein, partial [Elusimicrobia bacterium]|nr:CHASE2 domain-containing protein [Elusimicrobiota bacterium]